MDEHLGVPGTAAGWALHIYKGTQICAECGWWSHQATPPANPGVDGQWVRDHAARALRHIYPRAAAHCLQRAIAKHPAPDKQASGKKAYTRWNAHTRNIADRYLASRQEHTYNQMRAILSELWVEKRLAA